MKKYQLLVPEIHCNGCKSLIELELADSFADVKVDQVSKVVTFLSDLTTDEAESKLKQHFGQLEGYTYKDLTAV